MWRSALPTTSGEERVELEEKERPSGLASGQHLASHWHSFSKPGLGSLCAPWQELGHREEPVRDSYDKDSDTGGVGGGSPEEPRNRTCPGVIRNSCKKQ